MANLCRVRTIWTGSPVVGPGVSTFYLAEGATGFLADINVFWGNVGNRFPAGITWNTPSSGDLIDVATGNLTGTWTEPGTSSVNSSGTGSFASGVGVRIQWATSGVTNGRRVRGSTFLVPLTTACYQADGTIDGAILGGLLTSAAALSSGLGSDHMIWTRPKGGGGGKANPVIGVTVPDKVSWLRSRRT